MRERVVTFGEGGGLAGVLTEASGGRAGSPDPRETPGVVVLNSGLLHRVGPYRLSVDLGRTIGATGRHVLRFDLSGIGDSRMLASRVPARDHAVGDVRKAMDFMAGEYGLDRFVLMGLCSGSDNAHYASVRDPRVVGTVHLDGYAFPDTRYYIKYFGGRLLCRRYLRGKLLRMAGGDMGRDRSPAVAARTRQFPSRKELALDFEALIERGVRMLYVYTGGAERYNYEGQLRRGFPQLSFGDLLEEEFFPRATHTYGTLASRRRVVDRVVDWTLRSWNRPGVGTFEVARTVKQVAITE